MGRAEEQRRKQLDGGKRVIWNGRERRRDDKTAVRKKKVERKELCLESRRLCPIVFPRGISLSYKQGAILPITPQRNRQSLVLPSLTQRSPSSFIPSPSNIKPPLPPPKIQASPLQSIIHPLLAPSKSAGKGKGKSKLPRPNW